MLHLHPCQTVMLGVPTAFYMTRGQTLLKAYSIGAGRGNPRKPTALAQALAIQHSLFEDIASPKTSPSVRASLARSWSIVQESVRVIRGIPSPGQLRPDLDPLQLNRALKRARSRKPLIEIAGASGPFEKPEDATRPVPNS